MSGGEAGGGVGWVDVGGGVSVREGGWCWCSVFGVGCWVVVGGWWLVVGGWWLFVGWWWWRGVSGGGRVLPYLLTY